ncbi:MAG: PKD domain-containing protein [Propionicimonas sp.]
MTTGRLAALLRAGFAGVRPGDDHSQLPTSYRDDDAVRVSPTARRPFRGNPTRSRSGSAMFKSNSLIKRIGALTASVAVTATMLVAAVSAPTAEAAVLPTDPATVTAEGLPTWQVNGVVWSVVVVGNTAYATGEFSAARPPGEPVNSALSVPAKNIFAFDVTTGNPVPFNHSLNAQGLVVRANDAGTRLYVGGDFTEVDGVARAHIAAFDITSPGAPLTSMNARAAGQVRGLVPIGNTLYAGGNYRSAAGQVRSLFSAYDASTGDLLPWAPVGDTSGYVFAMVASPDQSRIIAGGSFNTINGVNAYGMGSIDAASGASLPWAANDRLRTAGNNGAITTLSTDGNAIFGAGYAFGSGAAFEGTFSADPSTGSINWVNDCLGDTYDTFPMGNVLYTVSHDHDCTMVGAFPDTNPRNRWTKASAERIGPTIGVTNRKDAYGWDYIGIPYTGLLHWYPEVAFGKYTASKQAGWTLGGNGQYLVMGGEFPSVNNVAQQGLVRFAYAPTSNGMKPTASTGSTPTAIPTTGGSVRVVFGAMYDRDDAILEYDVYRGVPGSSKRIATVTKDDAEFWNLPKYTIVDTDLPVGSQVRYQTRARDAAGNTQWSAWSDYVTVTENASAYTNTVAADGASHLWRLDEPAGSTMVVDAIGSAHGSPKTGTTLGGAGALLNETGTALTSTASGSVVTTTAEEAPAAVSVEAWVKTTSTRGGRIVGFGDQEKTGLVSTKTDRALYLDNSGRPNFMINDGAVRTVTAVKGINDGQWHHVVGTIDEAGMQLFVDGARVARDQRYNAPMSYTGFWRLGADGTTGFANRPTDGALAGTIDAVATYPAALTLAQVQSHFRQSGRTASWPSQPTDGYAASVLADRPDLYWRFDETSGVAVDSSGSGNPGNVVAAVTRGVAGAFSGSNSARFDGNASLVVAQQPWVAPTSFTAELWFNTTTTRGGKLIGFGNATSGLSGSYDRHVWMQNNGKLSFGTYPGTQQTITSNASYNDGQWHHLVAAQGADGMRLYVDAALVGTNPTTTSQAFTGYWRVGGDRNWSGATSNYFAGSLDEAAVYPTALSENSVRAHYAASGRTAPNQAPVAAFTATTSFLTANLDASTSTDPEAGELSYAWEFGDGNTGTGVTASHSYGSAGSYQVKLTVTDQGGLTNVLTQTVTVVANQAPTAAFTSSVQLHNVSFDAAGSADADGTIASYAWDFGDGNTGTGATATHEYGSAGSFTVALTVTDDQGATNTVSQVVETVDAPNQLPTAAFVSQASDLAVAFDASGSTDPDGSIASYAWDFGDTATGTGVNASHTYGQAGSYQVTLTVTDNRGGTATVTHEVQVLAANQAPTAAFSSTVDRAKVSLDASGSADADGTIASYAWEFGDGEVGSGVTASHTYAASGTYQVKLTVTDDRGGEGTVTHEVTVVGNSAPTAAFTSTTNGLAASFDGSASADADGTVASYAWEFGDGHTGTGATANHSYAESGTYSVKLTVTDNDGAENSVSHQVTVIGQGPLAKDSFNRSIASGGWGTADVGGAWTVPTGAARFSVADGTARMNMISAGSGNSGLLESVNSTDIDMSFDVTIDKPASGGGFYFTAIGRRVAGVGSYNAKVRVQANGTVVLYLVKTIGSTETTLSTKTITGLNFTAGDTLKVRFQVTGTDSTTLKAKVWSGVEPSGWASTMMDSTASLQAAGCVGMSTYVSGSSGNLPALYSFDNLLVEQA